MTETNRKSKLNIFLNKSNNQTKQEKNSNDGHSLKNNRFSNEIGKNTIREKKELEEKNKGFNATEELFPSLLNDYDLFMMSKTNKNKDTNHAISYKDITKNKEKSIKIETDEIEAGWVSLFKDENNKIVKVYGKTTHECLEIERKEREMKERREIEETNRFFRELEYERNLRKELFGDIQDFYDPLKDRFYTKEKDIVIYSPNDLSDSDTEGSNYDNQEPNDYLNDDNYL